MWTYISNRWAESRDLLLLSPQGNRFPLYSPSQRILGKDKRGRGLPLHLLPRDRPRPHESYDVTDITWVTHFMKIGCVTPVSSTKIPGWPVMKEGYPHPLFSPLFFPAPIACVFQMGAPSSNHPNMVRAFQGAWQYFSNFFYTVAMVTGVVGYPLPLTTQQWH